MGEIESFILNFEKRYRGKLFQFPPKEEKKHLAPLLFLAYLITVRETNSPPKNMTKKHFIHAAKLISCIPNMEEKIAAARVFYQVAESDNPNFDRERFLTACGISGK